MERNVKTYLAEIGQRGFVGAFALLLVVFAGCGSPSGVHEHLSTGPTMGTRYTVKVVGESLPEERREAVSAVIEEQLGRVNSRMSTYLPESELSRFNLFTGNEPYPLSPETLTVLREAMAVSEATDGAFDITVGLLVDAWGFGAAEAGPEQPTEAEIETLRGRVGWRLLEIEDGGVRKLDPLLACDLSAIAKGYAVDLVAGALEELGFHDYMVEVGGEVRVAGLSARREPWRIGIERPEATERQLQEVLPLTDVALATSGDYRNFVVRDGRRLSHTIDPRTGRPVEHAGASVTVLADRCMTADAWATALMVLGPEAGFELAVARSVPALFLVHDGDGGFREHSTPALSGRLAGVGVAGSE
jgi:thiamine biosynthesis lipoprotein